MHVADVLGSGGWGTPERCTRLSFRLAEIAAGQSLLGRGRWEVVEFPHNKTLFTENSNIAVLELVILFSRI